MTAQQLAKAEELVNSLPIPRRSIKVFGTINCNIHITCESRKTAEKWVMALGKFCRTVNCVESVDYAKENKGSCLNPTTVKVFKIGGVV